MINYEILTTEPAIEAMAPEWRELYAKAGENRGLFADADSFLIWWRTVGCDNRDPCVVTARKEGRLVGVLPLAVYKNRGLRILQAAGYKALSICEILCETPDLVNGLWNAARNSKTYHFADIRDVYADTPGYKALAEFASRRDVSTAHSLDLTSWSDSERWFKSHPHNMRYEIERKQRNLARKAPIVFKVYNGLADGPFPEEIVNSLLRNKLDWCRTRGKDGMFSHPKACEFYRELARAAAQRNAIHLGWLSCGEKALGYVLNFQRNGVISGYVTSYAPEWASYSPGILTITHSIRWAIDHGKKFYDLNQGDYQYKQKFSNIGKECAEFTFGAPTPIGRLAEKLYFGARAIGRRLRERKKNTEKNNAKNSANATKSSQPQTSGKS